MTKICAKCGIEKPIFKFYARASSKDGHQNACKKCTSELFKKNRHKYYGKPAGPKLDFNRRAQESTEKMSSPV